MFHSIAAMYQARWRKAAIALLVLWIVVTYLVISPMKCNSSSEELLEFQERLKNAAEQLNAMKQQHTKLISQIRRTAGFNGNTLRDLDDGTLFLNPGPGPSEEYEGLRRRVFGNTKELWYYINSQLQDVVKDSHSDRLKTILEQVAERKRSLLSDMMKLPELDGYQEWRQTEAANVSDLIQRRLHYLQNPPDCKEAKKVICNLNKGCGFGCQLHHIVYCLIYAYANERTMILHSKSWRYNPNGWDYVFYPLSDTCAKDAVQEKKVYPYPGTPNAKVIQLPFIDSLSKRPKYLPLAIPKDLAHRVLRFNGDPASWWIGQVLKYILKPKPPMQRVINETIAKMGFKGPIVGVHVRRTDKVGTEAAFHHISEYMVHVKEYYDQLELTQPVDVRRVYLASDDVNVLEDARNKYPDYVFLGDPSISRTAATHRRYTPESLTGLLVDLHLLSMCDYLVCTFSSQVGRVAYQMMQANRVDASDSIYSLDDIYYFGGQNAHDRLAVLPHRSTVDEEINLEVGDKVGIAGNHWNGFGRGHNRRTNQDGLVPYYKTVDHLVLYPFPEYKQVPLYTERRSGDGT